MSEKPDISPERSSEVRLPVRSDLVAGHLFFCRRIELPLGLEKGEERGAIELEFEQISPFPLEHLNLGYKLDDERKYALVYAAYRKRLDSERVKPWPKMDLVVPEFAVALTLDASDRSPLVLLSKESILVLTYDHRSNLPVAVVAHSREEPTEEVEIDEAEELQTVIKSHDFDGRVRIWNLEAEVLQAGKRLYFKAIDHTDGTAIENAIERDSTWSIDVRDWDTVDRVQTEDKRNVILWKAVLACCALLALLVLGELIFAGASGYLAMRNKLIEGQTPLVDQVGAMKTTIFELEAFEQADLDPVKMLAAIEPLRDQSTIYNKMETEGPFTLILEIDAVNVAKRNEFKKSLEEFKLIESVDESNPSTSNKGASSTLTLRFFPDYVQLLDKEIASNG